jgi:pimeloyl-ACP methyl ester carboxylesterase
MNRWELGLALIGLVCLSLGARSIRRDTQHLAKQELLLKGGGCQTPMTVLEPAGEKVSGTVLIIHGLSANRRLMQILGDEFARSGLRVYLLDLPGHGDNTDPFTFARAQWCAEMALESLGHAGRMDPKTTILVGHSLGAAIAMRMADREPVAATIAISPSPMIPPQRMPANLLVFSAEYDVGILKGQAERLAKAVGEERTQREDFAQQRAFQIEYVPHATHVSLVYDPRVAARSLAWADATLHPASQESSGGTNWGMPLNRAFRGSLLGLGGLLLLFPLAATMVARLAGPPRPENPGAPPAHWLMLVEGGVSALIGVLILTLVVPLQFLHIYTGDYLASLLLIVSALLLVLNWHSTKENLSFNSRQYAAAIILAFATFFAIGAWLNWQFDDAWLNAPRWLRFAGVLPVAWIYCYAEETLLGPVGEGKRRALRFAVFLLFRLELWLACALAVYKLASGEILIVILLTFLALFSILQRLATDALRRRIGSATACALFGAILAAWFIAAVFPLT